jgi:hypothetical protein
VIEWRTWWQGIVIGIIEPGSNNHLGMRMRQEYAISLIDAVSERYSSHEGEMCLL